MRFLVSIERSNAESWLAISDYETPNSNPFFSFDYMNALNAHIQRLRVRDCCIRLRPCACLLVDATSPGDHSTPQMKCFQSANETLSREVCQFATAARRWHLAEWRRQKTSTEVGHRLSQEGLGAHKGFSLTKAQWCSAGAMKANMYLGGGIVWEAVCLVKGCCVRAREHLHQRGLASAKSTLRDTPSLSYTYYVYEEGNHWNLSQVIKIRVLKSFTVLLEVRDFPPLLRKFWNRGFYLKENREMDFLIESKIASIEVIRYIFRNFNWPMGRFSMK